MISAKSTIEMEVKEEPVELEYRSCQYETPDPNGSTSGEYRSCQYESSNPNGPTSGEIMAICSITESVPTEVFTYVDTLNTNITEDQLTLNTNITEDQLTLNTNITEDQLTLNTNITEDQLTFNTNISEDQLTLNTNVINDQFSLKTNITEDQLKPHLPNVDLQPSVSDTQPQIVEQTSMSHALPKRMAQIQRRLQPDPGYRKTLAQPKDNNENKHAVCRKWRNGSSFVKNVRQMPNTESNQVARKQIEKPYPAQSGHINDLNSNHLKMPSPNPKTISVSGEKDIRNSMSEKSENTRTKHGDSAMEGLFGWTLIDDIFIPYIFRADNQKYVCVRLLEHKLLFKYPNIFPEELALREPLTSSFIKSSEYRVFNQLVKMQYKDSKDLLTFNKEDVVVLLSEFLSFYNIVKKTFPDLTEAQRNNSTAVENRKSGWVQINNTIIPYIHRSQDKLLPLAVLKHAASIDIETDGKAPTEEECKELNNRCSEEGFRFTFKLSSHLVSLALIEKSYDVNITELPDKDPMQHVQYVLEESPVSKGLTINTTHTNSHHAHHFQQLSQQTTNQNITEVFQSPDCLQPQIVFAYNKDPRSLQHGSPNVTIVPRHRVQQPFNAANLGNRFPNALVPNMQPPFIQNRMPLSVHNGRHIRTERQQIPTVEHIDYSQGDICSFNIQKNASSNDYEQPVIPGSVLNVLPQGQNINVNYGINIQNITPNHQISNEQVSHQDPNVQRNVHFTPVQSAPVNTQNTKLNHQCTSISDQSVMKVKQRQQNNTDTNSRSQDTAVCIPQQSSYHLRQKHAIKELLACIRGVWLGGKNVSCLHLNKPGRTGRFCLVEAICKLYYRNRTVNEFLFTIDKVLVTSACTDLEEQAFIEYYQLPVKVLKCNKMVELAAFEKMFPQLTEILTGNFPQYYTPPNTRCPYPLPGNYRSESMRRRSIQSHTSGEQTHQDKADAPVDEDKVIVLDN